MLASRCVTRGDALLGAPPRPGVCVELGGMPALPPELPSSQVQGGPAPRLLDRSQVGHQSLGRFNIKRVKREWWLRYSDFFHTIIHQPTWRLVLLAVACIVGSWLIFAVLFYVIAEECDLRIVTFRQAMFLSIETIETIGYGVPDSYFNNCPRGIYVLGAAALWSNLLNCCLISIVYTRFSRPGSRATSICFTDRAVVTRLGEHWYLVWQVCDLRKHQLVEAHVRTYSVQHSETAGGIPFQTRAMRLQHPDDELGGMLLLALPQVVVHRIDAWSPLCPPAFAAAGASPQCAFAYPEIPQRAADAENGNREGGAPPGGPDGAAIEAHLRAAQLEVLCLVEGIDPTTSNSLQCRHSYTADDIAFGKLFRPCVRRLESGACEVDFEAFHELVDSPQDKPPGAVVHSMP